MERKQNERKRPKKAFPFWMQLILFIALVFLLRSFVLGTTIVKGSSMEPNFHHGDIVFVNKLATNIGSPNRNDVIICTINIDGADEDIIKRVIGLPGDIIDIRQTGEDDGYPVYSLYVNDEPVDEPYIKEPMLINGDMEYPYEVPEDSYFVMGDNRNGSTDSRRKMVGAINSSDIKGKVVFRLYPFNSIGAIS